MTETIVNASHKTPAIENTQTLYVSQPMLVKSIITRTRDVFLFPYATVESTFATIISILLNPLQVKIPKTMNNMLKIVTVAVVFLPFST